jgi:hypothetical protein
MERLFLWILGPEPTIDDLLVLAATPDGEAHLMQLLNWRVERASLVAKGTAGVAVSFVITLLVAQFRAELHIGAGLLAVALVSAVLIAGFGVYVLRRLALLDTHYPQLLYLLRLLSR